MTATILKITLTLTLPFMLPVLLSQAQFYPHTQSGKQITSQQKQGLELKKLPLAVVPKGLVWLMDYGSVLTACLFEEEKSTTTHYHSPATTNQSSKHILAQLHLTKLHSNHKDQVVRIPPFSQSWASPPCPTTASPSHVPHAE